MNNIYTEIETLLTEHISESFEISEMADSAVLCVSVLDGSLGTIAQGITDLEASQIVEKYKFDTILPLFNIPFTIFGYVEKGEFFLFGVIVRGEDHEMSPERRAGFMELFNSNREGVKLRHVPVMKVVLSLPGAQNALANGNPFEEVAKYTAKAIVEQCGGTSPMTGRPRKGLAFKSLTSNYAFKAYSTQSLLLGSL